jgi:hypothetical protein
MGPSGIMPGSAYTSLDHHDRQFDLLNDSTEDYQYNADPSVIDDKIQGLKTQASKGTFLPEFDRALSDQVRGVPPGEFEDRVMAELQALVPTPGPVTESDPITVRDKLRNVVERTCETQLGVHLPYDKGSDEHAVFSNGDGRDYKVLAGGDEVICIAPCIISISLAVLHQNKGGGI